MPSSVYIAAGELGAIGLAGTLFNTVGLAEIPALTGAVLLTFLNIFVPRIGSVAGATEKEREVDAATGLASFVALAASTYALLPDGAGAGGGLSSLLSSLSVGELCVLSAAFFFAAAKVRLSSHLKVHGADVLTTGRLVAQAGLAAAGLGLVDETNLVHELLPSQQGGMGLDAFAALDRASGWCRPLRAAGLLIVASSPPVCALWCQGRGRRR